jgi:ATP-binding cassette subfamily C protein
MSTPARPPRSETTGAPASALAAGLACWRRLLTARERLLWLGLVPVAAGIALVEICGAAALPALVGLLDDGPGAHRPAIARFIPALAGLDARALTVAIAAIFLARSLLATGATAARANLACRTRAALSARMFRLYISGPYAFHLSRSSSELIHATQRSVERFFVNFMTPLVAAVSEVLILGAMAVVLLAAAPAASLAIGAGAVALVAAIVVGTRRAVVAWGVQMHRLEARVIKHVQQGVRGIKDVRILGCEERLVAAFETELRALARIETRERILAESPRHLAEAVFVIAIAAVVLVALGRGNAAHVAPLVSLFAYAGFRAVPSLTRLLQYVGTIRFARASCAQLLEDWKALAPAPRGALEVDGPAAPAGGPGEVALAHVSFRYEPDGPLVLDDVSLAVPRGRTIGLVGSTGCGKSTLLDILLGLLAPTSGAVTLDGAPLAGEALRAWRRRIGFVPQSVFLLDDTLRRNIAFGVPDADVDEARLRAAVAAAQLAPVVAGLAEGLDTVVGEDGARLSGGECSRVAVARALYRDPDVLILDEATASLDNRTEKDLLDAVLDARAGRTVVLVAHRLAAVRRCDEVVFLRGGRAEARGSFQELLERSAAFREMATGEAR